MAALKRPSAGELKRFLIAGMINTAFSYCVYALFLWLGISYPIANLAAMIGGVLIGFVTQGQFVFRKFEARRFPLFVVVWLLLWGLNVLLIRSFLPVTGGNAYIAGALALVIVVTISFVAQKYLVFSGGSRR